MNENQLLSQYKKDFFSKTGKQLSVTVLGKWESKCKLDRLFSKETIVKMIFDATGWNSENVFSPARHQEKVFKRNMIYFILHHNGHTLSSIANLFSKDHTSIMYGIEQFENSIENRKLVEKLFIEVTEYLQLNHNLYS